MQLAYDLIAAIFPIFAAIIVGAILKKYLIQSGEVWAGIDRLTYYLLLPALLMIGIYHADFSTGHAGTAVVITMAATLVLAAIMLIFRRVITKNTPLFTSIFQGSVRYNSYVLLAVAEALFGRDGLALAIVFIAVMVIVTNILAVVVLNALNGRGGNFKRIAMGLAKNPIILAAGAGAVLNIANTGIALHLAGINGMVLAMGVLYSAMPCAGNAYILARQLGGDADVMASIVTIETLFSAFTISVIAAILTVN